MNLEIHRLRAISAVAGNREGADKIRGPQQQEDNADPEFSFFVFHDPPFLTAGACALPRPARRRRVGWKRLGTLTLPAVSIICIAGAAARRDNDGP